MVTTPVESQYSWKVNVPSYVHYFAMWRKVHDGIPLNADERSSS